MSLKPPVLIVRKDELLPRHRVKSPIEALIPRTIDRRKRSAHRLGPRAVILRTSRAVMFKHGIVNLIAMARC
jgi:hypothetical protein